MDFDTTQTVGDIVRQYPAAVPVFEALGIDYCCGGNKSLEEACAKGNVSLNLVLSDLSSALVARPGPDEQHWMMSPLAELSAYIVEKHPSKNPNFKYLLNQRLKFPVHRKCPFADATGARRLCRVGGGARVRCPPSAAQTVRADFRHTAFTKTPSEEGGSRWKE